MTQQNPNMRPVNGNGGQQQIQVDPADLSDFLECDCGCVIFERGYRFGTLSAVHPKNPTGKTQLVPEGPHIVCKSCGEIQSIDQLEG